MMGERALFVAILSTALLDATSEGMSPGCVVDRGRADAWIRRGGRYFRQVCMFAGIDPDVVKAKYEAGEIDRRLLRAAPPRPDKRKSCAEGDG